MSEHNVASAADFKKLAEAAAWVEPERITLPVCGLGVVLRRPTKFYWALRRSAWPEALREKLDAMAGGFTAEISPEESMRLVQEDKQMLEEAFVSPKFCLNPGFDQFDPNWLPAEDAEFILKYLRGQVLADGQDLDRFPGGEPKSTDGGGPDGKDLRQPAGPVIEPISGRVAD